jgi:hypothetical protein
MNNNPNHLLNKITDIYWWLHYPIIIGDAIIRNLPVVGREGYGDLIEIRPRSDTSHTVSQPPPNVPSSHSPPCIQPTPPQTCSSSSNAAVYQRK